MIIKIGLIVAAMALVLFIGIQFIPVQRTNPPVLTQLDWDSPQTEALARRACMDCHSNETKWPWYAYVAPVSWLVAHDVEEGRHELNLSQLSANVGQNSRLAQKIQRQIAGGQMPKSVYLPMHPEAQLTSDEKQALETGLQKTLSKPPLATK